MLNLFPFLSSVSCDSAYPWQIGFQDGSTPNFEGIVELHDTIFFYLVVISFLVFWMLGVILVKFSASRTGIVHKYHNHGTLIELIWTITPALILIAIAFPSFKLLYLMDEIVSPTMTVKVAGHQWYWSYEYSDFVSADGESVEFDSYMIPESDLELGQLRLLDVDNRVVVPVDTHIRFIVTGQDVIHDFAVPSLGLKLDGIPGRLNQTTALIQREGVYYGQCSEICGVYHGFMPIVVEAVSLENPLWIPYSSCTPTANLLTYQFSDRSLTSDMLSVLYSLLEVLIVLVPILLSVAFMTIIERKVLASMQRRVGPNIVGWYGTLQPFADALKLVVKETVVPAAATRGVFYLAPVISLVFSLLGWAVIPFGSGLALTDFSLGLLYSLAASSIGIYGVLLAGWSANSKYAFLGSLRSTAQMISYELVLSSAVLTVIFLTGTFHYTSIIESQQSVWFVIPLLPVFVLFFISVLAETNRTPFDLPEAESELVAGFFTEHSSMPFVMFFLAEYCSIVLMSAFSAILFLGGYIMPEIVPNDTFINIQSIVLALKTCLFCFLFVWFRATLPRLRYQDLMVVMWTGFLPVVIALVLLVPSILVAFDVAPY
ncbi:NADH dehydrogenase subunit 1 (mitochondrion) [Pseudohyphozyma bogoriensis]|nr:NADH dehydrogenase subunit 1 [Pseudohyphozyma bogoriensis]KAI5474125.1 NADH dehydrogenase subunit 1 [Pseudohyphozyma bogoriensis]